MLGPFRIRHLSRPPSPPGQRSLPRTTPRVSARDAIVSLTGGEYDKTIAEHPESKLKYVDEADGDVVTVSPAPQATSEPEPASRSTQSFHVYPTYSCC